MHPSADTVDKNTHLNWNILLQLLPYLKEFKGRVFLALVFMILAKVATVQLPLFIGRIVKSLSLSTDDPANLLVVPVALIISYGAFRFLMVLLAEIRDSIFGRVTEHSMRKIGLKVFRHIHDLDIDFHLNKKTGGLSRDIERGTTGISFLMRFMIFNIVPTIFEITLVLIILFYKFGWIFAAITIIAIIAYILFSFSATEWRLKFIREANLADSSSSSQAIDSLLNYETVKYFTNEDFEANRYDKELANWESARRKKRLSLFVVNAGQALIIATAITFMLYFAAQGIVDKTLDISDLVTINAFMMQLFIPLNFLGFVYREIKVSLVNIEKMFLLLAVEPKVKDDKGARDLKLTHANIVFDDVSFSYSKERPILENISFEIHHGEKVAIVGSSGAGKSTVVKLLFRFYDPTQGKICIDNQDIKLVTQKSLRKAMGIVPQDTVLFNDSILENIRYGNTEATDEEVYKAIKLAHLEQFIQSLPDGVHTRVGERGLKLSGGEKQRVSIARAILKKPQILVFDEATSSLDSKSEKAILAALEEISIGHTSVSIAHRLSTIVNSDKILVLDNGELVEQGTHETLLQKQGIYAELWKIQQKQKQ
ncbi:MAG TPA: ABC transporter ATP-binding protein/permease [Aeromonadales bacterium]|nr:ABC transporter ATP-binding protein/permease [Aeromonadales bacterium]